MTVPASVSAPDVPVAVTVYIPAVVAGRKAVQVPDPFPPPHAITPVVRAARRVNIPSMVRQLRRRAGMPMSRMQAKAAPPPAYHGTLWRVEEVAEQPMACVVVMVRLAVPAVAPAMLTGVVEPKLKVGGFTAPAGPEVTAAVSATLPVKPPDGVTVMMEMFPVVAPAVTVTAVPVTVKLGLTAVVTVIEVEPAMELKLVSPA